MDIKLYVTGFLDIHKIFVLKWLTTIFFQFSSDFFVHLWIKFILIFFEQDFFQLNHSASPAFADVSALLATMMIILPRNIDDETCAKTQISTTYRKSYHSCHTLNWAKLSNLGSLVQMTPFKCNLILFLVFKTKAQNIPIHRKEVLKI